jgi:RimJ/RimL family protein N-acetyltransferase
MSTIHIEMRSIDAGNLVLEPQVAAHAGAMFEVLRDPAIYVYENEPPPSLEWLSTRFAKLESRRSADGSEQWLNWVVRMPDGALAGYVQATIAADRHADIAYIFASAYWGRGLASQAVAAMLAELVGHYGVHRFVAVLKCDNFRSGRLLERLGFVRGTPEQHAAHAVDPDELLMWHERAPT